MTQIDLLPSSMVEAGEVFCGSLDSPLSADGRKALKKAVRRRNDWNVVVTSPRSCCLSFADWIGQRHSIPVQTLEGMREMDFGRWEGQPPSAIMLQDPTILARWWRDPASLTPPEGEAFTAFRGRVLADWRRLLKEQQGKTVLLVTHPGVVRVLITHALGMSTQQFFAIQVESATFSRISVSHDAKGVPWACLTQHGCGS